MRASTEYVAQRPRSSTEHERPKVAIVGAGLAGLACADALTERGFDVHVFEARSRVGGRVWSLAGPRTGQIAEAGGEFIGRIHSTWLAYAQRFGLELNAVDSSDEERLADHGVGVPPSVLKGLQQDAGTHINSMTAQAGSIDGERPWMSDQAAIYDSMTVQDWVDDLRISSPQLRRYLIGQFEGLNAVPARQQSLLGQFAQIAGGGLEQYWEGSTSFRCATGTQSLARALAEQVGSPRLHMQRPVTAINLEEGAVYFGSNKSQSFTAGHIVLTTPPSVWKYLDFWPRLPLSRAPQMGIATKHISWLNQPQNTVIGWSTSLNDAGVLAERWGASQPGRAPHVVTYFVPSRAQELQKVLASFDDLPIQRQSGPYFTVDWPREPWSEGAYPFPAPGEITAIGAKLQETHGTLQFAGDWAAYSHIGYMEGALRSGLKAAARISHENA